jgi:hypothetical protein
VDCAVVSKVFPDFSFAFDSHSLSWLFTTRLRLRLRPLFYSRRVDATECVERKREREREREREMSCGVSCFVTKTEVQTILI